MSEPGSEGAPKIIPEVTTPQRATLESCIVAGLQNVLAHIGKEENKGSFLSLLPEEIKPLVSGDDRLEGAGDIDSQTVITAIEGYINTRKSDPRPKAKFMRRFGQGVLTHLQERYPTSTENPLQRAIGSAVAESSAKYAREDVKNQLRNGILAGVAGQYDHVWDELERYTDTDGKPHKGTWLPADLGNSELSELLNQAVIITATNEKLKPAEQSMMKSQAVPGVPARLVPTFHRNLAQLVFDQAKS